MKKIANKTICLLLTLVMLLGVMPLAGGGGRDRHKGGGHRRH